jgi:elongation factor P
MGLKLADQAGRDIVSINFGDLNRGMVIELEGQPWQIMDYERHKMQQRAPVTRIKMKNLISGAVVERTFQRYDTQFTVAEVDNRQTQYLYTDGNYFYFLDQETFDQYDLTREQLGSSLGYLKENMMVELVFYKGNPINLNLPIHVELEVTETPPAFRGDTAQGGNKPATLETGLKINVPMFITPGTVVRVDTRTGEYTERVS